MSGHSMSGHSNQLKSSNVSNRYVNNGKKKKKKEKERKKEKQREKPKLLSLKYSFIMFEISIEKRFEINGNCLKNNQKNDQNEGLGRVRNQMGNRTPKKTNYSFYSAHFGRYFGASLPFKM